MSMRKTLLSLVAMLLLASPAIADICPRCGRDHLPSAVASQSDVRTKVAWPEVNRDERAYQHALREAKMLASGGRRNYPGRYGGHPLGVAPGCRYSGTGYTHDRNRPGHCYEYELPQSRIIARARAFGDGVWWWHASYR